MRLFKYIFSVQVKKSCSEAKIYNFVFFSPSTDNTSILKVWIIMQTLCVT